MGRNIKKARRELAKIGIKPPLVTQTTFETAARDRAIRKAIKRTIHKIGGR